MRGSHGDILFLCENFINLLENKFTILQLFDIMG